MQALGGAKNHAVVLPDADLEFTADALIGAAYGSAGERCMAICAVVAVGAAADPLVTLLEKKAKAIKSTKLGGVDMGPLVTCQHRDKVASYVEQGVKEGAKLVVDARKQTVPKEGFFLGTSLFDHVTPEMEIYKNEIFGPVLVVLQRRHAGGGDRAGQPEPLRQRHGDLHRVGRRRAALRRARSRSAWSASTCRSRCRSRSTRSAAGRARSSATCTCTAPRRQVLYAHQGDHHALAAPGHAGAGVQHADAGMRMRAVLVGAAVAMCATVVHAQEYPAKTIRLIVPLSAGAGADIAGRIVAQRMSEHWKQPVIVENRPGAGGQIGTSAVVKAEADGHTLLVQSSSHAANPAIYRNLPYDPQKDLIDVAILGKTPYVMVSAGNGPYRSLKALIDAAKAKPGELAYSSAGVGTSTHLAAEYLLGLAGVRMIHVPFKGSPDALQDVLGGRSAFYMAPVNVGLGLVKEGKLNPLGVSTRTRAEVLPQVPTLAEQGMRDYEVTLWFGMWAPAGYPGRGGAEAQRRGERDRRASRRCASSSAKLGLQPSPMKPEEFAAFVRTEIGVYKRIVEQAGIERQ